MCLHIHNDEYHQSGTVFCLHMYIFVTYVAPSHIICDLVQLQMEHDDVIEWKHFPRYWPFVREIHRSPVNSPHKGQWRGAFMFPLICVGINSWLNNREAGDLRRYCAHYDASVMKCAEAMVDNVVCCLYITSPQWTHVMCSTMCFRVAKWHCDNNVVAPVPQK